MYIDGDQFTSHQGSLSAQVLIDNSNSFLNEYYSGVFIANLTSATSTTPQITISNNNFYGNGSLNPGVDGGIRLRFVEASFQIDHNKIGRTSPTIGVGNSVGIRIEGSVTSDVSSIAFNTINASTYDGISIANSTLPNLYIFSNYIGVEPTLSYNFGNGGSGISLALSTINKIGGSLSTNYIGVNQGNGIDLSSNSSVAVVEYNVIFQNSGSGILASSGAVAATIDRNDIRYNAISGVRLSSSAGTGTAILENYFEGNAIAPIDLQPVNGINQNDPEDTDTGPNHLLNYPEIVTSSRDAAGNWTIFYDLDVDKLGTYRIEFYRYSSATKKYTPITDNPSNPTAFAFAFANATSLESGKQRFRAVIGLTAFGLMAGETIVTTLTGVTGGNTDDTSEFSTPIPFVLVNGAPRVVDVVLDKGSLVGQPSSEAGAGRRILTRQSYRLPNSLTQIFTLGANAIQIKFSEHVRRPNGSSLNGTELKLYATRKTSNLTDPQEPLLINATAFYYNPDTFEATWTFPTFLASKYRIDFVGH